MTCKTRSFQIWGKVFSAPRKNLYYQEELIMRTASSTLTLARRRFSLIHKVITITTFANLSNQNMKQMIWMTTSGESEMTNSRPLLGIKSGWWVLYVFLCLELLWLLLGRQVEFKRKNNFKSLKSKISIRRKRKLNLFNKNLTRMRPLSRLMKRKVRERFRMLKIKKRRQKCKQRKKLQKILNRTVNWRNSYKIKIKWSRN